MLAMNGLSSTHSRMTLPWKRPFPAASARPENTANMINKDATLNSDSRSNHYDTPDCNDHFQAINHFPICRISSANIRFPGKSD
jgi:hypothetical protein